MTLMNRIIKYLWEYYRLSDNDTEHMDALRNDIFRFIDFCKKKGWFGIGE